MSEYFFKNSNGIYSCRRLSDNLLTIQSIVDYCEERGIEGYLVSLDAKKTFNSVDHQFMLDMLKKIYFGTNFINIVKTLYTKLTADIMVYGIRYGLLKILKGVKQGD